MEELINSIKQALPNVAISVVGSSIKGISNNDTFEIIFIDRKYISLKTNDTMENNNCTLYSILNSIINKITNSMYPTISFELRTNINPLSKRSKYNKWYKDNNTQNALNDVTSFVKGINLISPIKTTLSNVTLFDGKNLYEIDTRYLVPKKQDTVYKMLFKESKKAFETFKQQLSISDNRILHSRSILNSVDEISLYHMLDTLRNEFLIAFNLFKESKITLEQLLSIANNYRNVIKYTEKFGVNIIDQNDTLSFCLSNAEYDEWMNYYDSYFINLNDEMKNDYNSKKLSGQNVSMYKPDKSWSDSKGLVLK